MTRKPIIRIVDVWKTYKMGEIEVHALRGMNFEVKRGEFVAIMGPSGSGKATAVNMVGVLDRKNQNLRREQEYTLSINKIKKS